MIITIFGLGLIFLIEIQYHIGFFTRLKSYNLGRIENDLLIIVASFIAGRLLILISDTIDEIESLLLRLFRFLVLEPSPLKARFKTFFQNIKLNWKNNIKEYFFYQERQKHVSYNDVKNDISAIDMADAVKNNPSLGSDTERSVYQLIFTRLLLSISLLASIFISPSYLFVFFILLYLLSLIKRELAEKQYLIYKGVVKSSHKDNI